MDSWDILPTDCPCQLPRTPLDSLEYRGSPGYKTVGWHTHRNIPKSCGDRTEGPPWGMVLNLLTLQQVPLRNTLGLHDGLRLESIPHQGNWAHELQLRGCLQHPSQGHQALSRDHSRAGQQGMPSRLLGQPRLGSSPWDPQDIQVADSPEAFHQPFWTHSRLPKREAKKHERVSNN